jgi:hypothetical protein
MGAKHDFRRKRCKPATEVGAVPLFHCFREHPAKRAETVEQWNSRPRGWSGVVGQGPAVVGRTSVLGVEDDAFEGCPGAVEDGAAEAGLLGQGADLVGGQGLVRILEEGQEPAGAGIDLGGRVVGLGGVAEAQDGRRW